MLNELSLLAKSLDAKGLSVPSWDNRIKPFKKGPAYVIRLDSQGHVAGVEWMAPEVVEGVRRISPQNEKSFPGFNLNHAIYEVDPAWFAEGDEAVWDHLVRSLKDLRLAGGLKDRAALSGNLRYPVRELAAEFKSDGADLIPTRELICRISALETEVFLAEIGIAVVNNVVSGALGQDQAIVLLCGKFNRKKGVLDPAKATLILDVDDARQLGGRVASIESAHAWNRALLAPKSSDGQSTDIVCSLSGQPDLFIGEKMPQPNLPGLGLTYLMSMNKATPCQMRYGLTSTAICPIGQQSGQRLSDALQFVTDGSREGKTFAKVPNGSSDNSDLLVCYLEDTPDSDMPVVDLFADMLESPEGSTGIYEERASKIIGALRGSRPNTADSAIRIFAISKLDPGRSQVLFSGCYSLRDLESGLGEWFHGMRNLPEIRIPFAGAKGQKAQWREPLRPSPIQVLRTFKTLWIRGGAESVTVPGVDLAQIYRLMLEPAAEIAAPLLNRLLGLSEALLCGLGALRADPRLVPERSRGEGLIVLPVLGLLLQKLGFTKENYMESREFLLGQFLQLADRLHKLYCEEVRKGSIPPQLAGNAVLPAALQNPERAFQTACQRIRVYLAWADSFSGDKAGLAIWLRRKIAEVCRKLQDLEGVPVQIDDSGRAKLFLGYLGDLMNKEQSA